MKIYKLGEEVLRQQCTPVELEEINDELRKTIAEMFDTMISADGVGLAAPQVGIPKRFFVIMSDDDIKRVFINPVITKTSTETCSYDEGCLSIPGVSESITRPASISITALNENGKRFTMENVDGLLARIIQHENDHLDGVLYIDRGDKQFKDDTVAQFKKRAAKAEKKAISRAKKQAAIAAKIAAKQTKKGVR